MSQLKLWFGAFGVLAAQLLAAPGVLADDLAEAGAQSFHVPDAQLARLVEELLAGSPEIRAARAVTRSLSQRVAQEKALPDPGLRYRYFVDSIETRVGPQRYAVELTQSVPWPGKRDLSARRARHDAGSAGWSAIELQRARVAELKRAYFETAYLQEALTVNAEEAELLRRFEQIALTRYSTGEGIQQSVIRVQTDISRLLDRQAALEARIELEKRRIAALIGRAGSALGIGPIALGLLDLENGLAGLEDEYVRDHPSVRAVRERIRAEESLAARREIASRPDLRFALGYTAVQERRDAAGKLNPPEDNGQDSWAVTVGVDLPIGRQRIRAGIAEARESVQAAEDSLDAMRDRLRFDVQRALIRIESLTDRARFYDEVVIPQAGESVASAEAAYTTNRQGFLDLIDAERVLFQARLTFHRLLADYWIALADLERALGRPFPEGRIG